jgi:hypothetical protein
MIAEYIDSIIMFCVGLYGSAVGFGLLPAPIKDPIAGKQWLAQWGKFFKIGGPLLVVISLILAVAKFLSRGGA